MRPTFASFNVAKRGLDAARANLSITGQNMTNANTPGYVRQRVDLNSIGAMGWQTRYANPNDLYVGEGVSIAGTSQFRDPYLDVRFRREHAKVANSDTQLDTLNELKYVFDEITKDGLNAQFSDLCSQLQNLSGKANDPVAEGIVKTSALMLVKLFNHSSELINGVKQQQLEYLQNGSVEKANELLKGIATVNEEIKKANIAGNPALELVDSRNSMIDELSGIVNLEVATKKVSIGSGIFVEELSVNLIGNDGQKFNLVDNGDFKQFDLAKDPNTQDVETPITILLKDKDGLPVGGSNTGVVSLDGGDITSQITTGDFAAHLKMLNSAGEFDNPATKERGIQYYEKMMNTIVHEFANIMNSTNSNTVTKVVDGAGNPILDSEGRDQFIYDKPMFESTDGKPIDASNIKISDKWNNTPGSYLTATKNDANGKPVDNILTMISKLSCDVNFTAPATGTPLFKGNFQSCFTNISITLGLETRSVGRENDSYAGVLIDIDKQRASISSVNMDEEGINLIQFNQSLSASSRYMTTLDEAVDTIINRMGIVGR